MFWVFAGLWAVSLFLPGQLFGFTLSSLMPTPVWNLVLWCLVFIIVPLNLVLIALIWTLVLRLVRFNPEKPLLGLSLVPVILSVLGGGVFALMVFINQEGMPLLYGFYIYWFSALGMAEAQRRRRMELVREHSVSLDC